MTRFPYSSTPFDITTPEKRRQQPTRFVYPPWIQAHRWPTIVQAEHRFYDAMGCPRQKYKRATLGEINAIRMRAMWNLALFLSTPQSPKKKRFGYPPDRVFRRMTYGIGLVPLEAPFQFDELDLWALILDAAWYSKQERVMK